MSGSARPVELLHEAARHQALLRPSEDGSPGGLRAPLLDVGAGGPRRRPKARSEVPDQPLK